ncbi:MAG: hypothetical protein KOO60_04540 [Gemmatimonadales bacterium]|nr:hypothetical protein [Gemmatimonadales bacterium]
MAEAIAEEIAEPRTVYFEARKLLDCKLFLPDSFDPSREYPLVIGLHGYGGSPEGLAGLWTYFPNRDFILAIPEAPYAYPGNGVKMGDKFSWDFKVPDKNLWQKADPWVYEYILRVVGDLQKEYKISTTVLFGFSQGVAYAYAAGFHSEGLVDGLICFGGTFPSPDRYPWLLDEITIKSGAGLRIFIAHGKTDQVISSERSIRAVEKLRGYQCEVEIHLFDGGHMLPKAAVRKAFAWFDISS